MTRLLIAVKSCHEDKFNGFHYPIRNTWGRDLPFIVDLKFFMGHGCERSFLEVDEIIVDAKDDYQSLPFKTKEILKKSLDYDYDYTFLCDTDTCIIPARLMTSGFGNWDYMGVNGRPWGQTFAYDAPNRDGVNYYLPHAWPWCSGGFGYFLSRKAAEIVVKEEPLIWAEDVYVGQVLGPLIARGEIRARSILQGAVAYHYTRTPQNWSYRPELKWMETTYERETR